MFVFIFFLEPPLDGVSLPVPSLWLSFSALAVLAMWGGDQSIGFIPSSAVPLFPDRSGVIIGSGDGMIGRFNLE